MNTLVLLLAMLDPKPACFEIEVETNTEVVCFIGEQRVEPGKTYRTEPLFGSTSVELTVRYIDGGEVKTKIFWLNLEPGYKIKFSLMLYANPPLELPC